MSKLPPSLLYLTVYNPTLKPTDPKSSDDDEDAEEQAQILFYTARERAVSRDTMLRQVGLAKALVNFASMFNAAEPCENTHSQSRRMVMVSPEPNFWIHACVELAKTRRQPKAKPETKGKGKENVPAQEPVFEYHDGSVNDAALREHILNGYQRFKLLHGSFASILDSLGQVALELQLERFFTVWAWHWDFDDCVDFGEQLGVSLHEAYKDVALVIDRFAEQHVPNSVTFVLSPPHLLPSSALLASRYPSALARHVMQRIPPPPPSTTSEQADEDGKGESESAILTSTNPTEEKKSAEGSKVAIANPFANMDVRNLKWMWSGLTFGKTSSKSSKPAVTSPLRSPESLPKAEDSSATARLELPRSETEVEVDTESLQDAIESENIHLSARPSPAASPAPQVDALPDHIEQESEGKDAGDATDARHTAGVYVAATEGIHPEEHGLVQGASEPRNLDDPEQYVLEADSQEAISSPLTARPPPEREPPPAMLSTPVFLPQFDAQEHITVRKRVFHATKGVFTFAVVAEEEHDLDLELLARRVEDLFDDVQEALITANERDSQGSVLTVTKILEPQDKHLVSTGPYTLTSTGFTSTSEHLFNAREILRSDLDVLEVFSRGQNPQHWHIGRRGLDTGDDDASAEGEVYMEVARKESTLTDVDNGLASVINRISSQ